MKYLSVCSGIEAATTAWEPLGWEPIAFSEIDKFPSAVLAARWPTVPNLGDFTKITRDMLTDDPDVVVGGTPCQAFSVAGLRNSLEDDRGNLTLAFVHLVDRLKPRVVLWENVPGTLSTKDNAFGFFLGGLAGSDEPLRPTGKRWANAGLVFGPKRNIAWRVLDAQHFGVAQRRKRLFVVACPVDGVDPAAILLECEGDRRDSPPSREARQVPAETLSLDAALRDLLGEELLEVSSELCEVVRTYDLRISSNTHEVETSTTLDTRAKDGPRRNQGGIAILQPVVIDRAAYNQGVNAKFKAIVEESEVMPPLVAMGPHAIGVPQIMASGQANSEFAEDMCTTQSARQYKDPPILAQTFVIQDQATRHAGQRNGRWDGKGNGLGVVESETMYTLTGGDRHAVMSAIRMVVRRLLPVECARLQGFPDDHAKIPWGNKPVEDCPDGHQYKCYGNSMAVPVIAWLGSRIEAVLTGKPFTYGIPEAYRVEIESRSHPQAAVALSMRGREGGNMPELEPGDILPALRTGQGGSGNPMVMTDAVGQ